MRAYQFILPLIVCCCSNAQLMGNSPLKSLYERHQWFELRDEIARQADVPALYRGAVAAAFNNRKEAETILRDLIAAAPGPNAAYEAHKWLVFYLRAGQYGQAVAETRAKWVALPDRDKSAVEHEFMMPSRVCRISSWRSLAAPA